MASTSPRRRELIKALDWDSEVLPPGGDEPDPEPNELAVDYAKRVSWAKAMAVCGLVSDAIVIGADTSVVIDGRILGKPIDVNDAISMLKLLRNRTHHVVTGVAVVDSDTKESWTATRSTRIVLRNYSDAEIDTSVASGYPMDKAGAYAVQDRTYKPAKGVFNCYSNALGLPMCKVVRLLAHAGIHTSLRPGAIAGEPCPDAESESALEDDRDTTTPQPVITRP